MGARHDDERIDGASATSRRTVLKALGAGLGAAAFLSPAAAKALEVLQATDKPSQPVFLTADEFAVVDALSERLIPADERSPGAKAARVADYTGFFLMGKLIEFDTTTKIFKTPAKKETEDYITGRFG